MSWYLLTLGASILPEKHLLMKISWTDRNGSIYSSPLKGNNNKTSQKGRTDFLPKKTKNHAHYSIPSYIFIFLHSSHNIVPPSPPPQKNKNQTNNNNAESIFGGTVEHLHLPHTLPHYLSVFFYSAYIIKRRDFWVTTGGLRLWFSVDKKAW